MRTTMQVVRRGTSRRPRFTLEATDTPEESNRVVDEVATIPEECREYGEEIVKRWNAHPDLLAFAVEAVRALDAAYFTVLADMGRAALAKARV